MYQESVKDRVMNVLIWFRYFGWMIAVALIGIALIGWGMYALAVSAPTTKVLVALSGIVAYFILGKIAPKIMTNKAGVVIAGALQLAIIVVTCYSLFLSLFVLPWYISAGIVIDLAFALVFVLAGEKKIQVTIPAWTVWARNLIFLAVNAGMAYYLGHAFGLF